MRKSMILLAAAGAGILPLSPLAAVQDEQATNVAELRALVDQTRGQMLRPGERVPGWDRGGADPDGDVRARGADSHYMLTRGDDGDSVVVYTSRSIADVAPESWRVVDSYGDPATPLEDPQIQFEAASARYVFAIRSQFTRRGDVSCTSGIANARLYERPGAPGAENDEMVPFVFRIVLLALEGQELCVRTDGNAERGYTSRTFLPDGHLLPEMSSGRRVGTIIPAGPIDRLVVWRREAPRRSD